MIGIQVIATQLARLTKAIGHIKDGVPKAVRPAVWRALELGRTEIKREVRKAYVVKAGLINVRLQMEGMNGTASVEHPGMLKLYDMKLNPKGVQTRKQKKPVFAQVKVGGGGTMPGAFVAQMQSGHVGVFIRQAGAGRNPINELHTISPPIMASQPAVGPAVNKRMDHELRRVLASA